MYNLILTKIGTLILAAIPISLIAATQLSKIFSTYNAKLGKVTTILTGIKGILTKEELAIKSITFDKYRAKIDEENALIHLEDIEKKEEIRLEKRQLQKDETLKLISTTTSLCHYPKIKKLEEIILKFFSECGLTKGSAERNYDIIERIPLTERKKLSTVVAKNIETNEIFAFTKGNPKIILEKCTRILLNGQKIDLSTQTRRKIRKRVERLGKKGQKVIAFAYKGLPKKILEKYTEQFTESDLIFLGVIGVGNPLNTDIIKDINTLKESGIKILISTHEKERKAVAIAKQLQVINPNYFESLSGDYVEHLSDQKLQKMLSNKEKDYIFSRLKEKDKQRILGILKQLGENAIEINKKGKNAFRSILKTIRKSRITNENYKKLVNHALACKIAEIALLVTALATKTPLPLSITLIILLDILINLPLELALKSDNVDKNVLEKSYKPPPPSSLNKKSIAHLIINSLFISAILAITYIHTLLRYGWIPGENLLGLEAASAKAMTISFLLLAIIQILNAYNIRSFKKSLLQKGILSNLHLILTTIIAILIIYILFGFPSIKSYLGLTSLSTVDWQILAFSAISIIILEEIKKFTIRTFTKNENPQK